MQALALVGRRKLASIFAKKARNEPASNPYVPRLETPLHRPQNTAAILMRKAKALFSFVTSVLVCHLNPLLPLSTYI